MAKYVGAIDQGTTSTRFMVFDHDGHELARHQLPHEQIVSDDGWVEHDPHEIWEATQDVIETALGRAGVGADDLVAIGITNQHETTVVWDRRTGEPYHNALAWQDSRTDAIGWILDHVDGVRADAEAGHAIVGTIDSWLIWWLTGGPDDGLHLTDVTNADRTTLMDRETLAWDGERLAQRGIPGSMLPGIRSSSQVYGTTTADGPFGGEVVIAGALADQQAALVGQMCLAPGELQITYGVGAAMMLNTGTRSAPASAGLRPMLAYRFGDAAPVHALAGSVTVEGLDDRDAGSLCRDVGDVAGTMAARAGLELQIARVDGGLAADETCMQIQAEVLGVPVSRPVIVETSALGAAYAAGLAVGFWASVDDLVESWHESTRWHPASA